MTPQEWLNDPPESLVVGEGPYAKALAMILDAASLGLDDIGAGPDANEDGGYPRVLESLRRVLLVVPASMSPGDALRGHESVWNWVGKLTSLGDQHEIAFVFVIPSQAPESYERSLALGLGLPSIEPPNAGCAVWRQSGSLCDLVSLLAQIVPADLLPLRARRAADARHAALSSLKEAALAGNPNTACRAAERVLALFRGREHDLDIFCRPPCHRHGNLLRAWLANAVTGSVTPDWWEANGRDVVKWLA